MNILLQKKVRSVFVLFPFINCVSLLNRNFQTKLMVSFWGVGKDAIEMRLVRE